MRVLLLLAWLIHTHGTSLSAAEGKRFDASMVDPLMRRSSLDKNFMRFGRSSTFTNEEDEEVDDNGESTKGSVEASKEDNFLRSTRGKINFIRFGRGKNDNFMRFGRGNQNFMRFGRGNQNFMRFGRGRNDNFMRFGRGKQENFMRFGRDIDDYSDFDDLENSSFNKDPAPNPDLLRLTRGKQENFMRFGRPFDEQGKDDMDIPIELRSPGMKSNFMRFGRGKQQNFLRFGKAAPSKNFMRFGKSEEHGKDQFQPNSKDADSITDDDFRRVTKSKDLNLVRLGRRLPNEKNTGFIRFGRGFSNQEDHQEDNIDLQTETIPMRLKRSVDDADDSQFEEMFAPKTENVNHSPPHSQILTFPDDLEEEYVASLRHQEMWNRRKRSLEFGVPTTPPFGKEPPDDISLKIPLDAKPLQYSSSLLSAGIPNLIVGPEFSLLPALDPPSSMLKRGRPGDQNFIRLG